MDQKSQRFHQKMLYIKTEYQIEKYIALNVILLLL